MTIYVAMAIFFFEDKFPKFSKVKGPILSVTMILPNEPGHLLG